MNDTITSKNELEQELIQILSSASSTTSLYVDGHLVFWWVGHMGQGGYTARKVKDSLSRVALEWVKTQRLVLSGDKQTVSALVRPPEGYEYLSMLQLVLKQMC